MPITSIKLYPPEGYGSAINLTASGRYLGDLVGWIGHAPVQYDTLPMVGRDGVRVMGARLSERIIDIPIVAVETSFDNLMAKLEAIYTAAGYRGGNTYCRLVVNDAYELRLLYLGETHRPITGSSYEITMRFLATDPYWYQISKTSYDFNLTYYTINCNNVLGRDTYTSDYLWYPYGNGTSGTVYTAGYWNGQWYIGGSFTTAGSNTVNNIARLTNGNWFGLGSGTNGAVYELLVGPDGYLYACGSFTTAGGVTVNRIARWTGSTWQALGTGANATVRSMAFDRSGNLIIGGDFSSVGGVSANRVARWNGASWSAIGAGLSNSVLALLVAPDNSIYAGGTFIGYISRWDGSSWSLVGGGFNAAVRTLAMDDKTGYIYAGGSMTALGGGGAINRVAVWDGVRWKNFSGDNPNSDVYTLHFVGGSLWVGGSFTAIGSFPYKGVAFWHGDRYLPPEFDFVSITSPTIYTISSGLMSGYTLIFLGGSFSGTYHATPNLAVGGTAGNAAQKPLFSVTGPCTLRSILHLDTNKSIRFNDLRLSTNETLTIDTNSLTITSNTRGNMLREMLANSNLVDFELVSKYTLNLLNIYTLDGGTAKVEYYNRYRTLSEAL